MKIICLTFCLIAAASGAIAATCTDAAKIMGDPCTPPPGKGADDAKQAILDLLDRADALEADLALARYEYEQVRGKADLEKRYKAAEAYHNKKEAQNRIYEEVIQRTRLFYNVERPNNGMPVTIGKPADPASDFIKGLKSSYNPKPAEYNPDGMLGVKIRGADGQYHYGGVIRDAGDGTQRMATTLENGKVLIFKETFEIARKYRNPGYIGRALFHEAHHFNQLSRPSLDGSAEARSWASEQEDEVDAYMYDVAWAAAFGLDEEDIKGLKAQLKTFESAVANKEFTWKDTDPAKEALRKKYYEEAQINIDEEFSDLHAQVTVARKKQVDHQNEERARRERAAEERERTAREAEDHRLEDERAAAFYRQTLANEAAACGYNLIIRSRENDAVIGISGLQSRHGFTTDGVLPFNPQDLKIVLLLTRTCDAIKKNYQQDACNDSTPAIRERASTNELKIQLDHILGAPATNKIDAETRNCVDYFVTNAAKITDTKSLEELIAKYRKELEEEQREYDKRWRSGPTTPPSRGGGGSPPPEVGNNDRIWDPGCGCWIRRQ